MVEEEEVEEKEEEEEDKDHHHRQQQQHPSKQTIKTKACIRRVSKLLVFNAQPTGTVISRRSVPAVIARLIMAGS